FRVSCDMDDPAASLADEVGGRLIGRLLIINKDAGTVFVLGDAVKKDKGDLFFEERFEVCQRIGVVGQGHQQAVYAAVKEGGGVSLFFFNRLGRLADDEVIAFAVGDILHAGDD